MLKWKINGKILPKICKFENNCGDSGLKTLIAYAKIQLRKLRDNYENCARV